MDLSARKKEEINKAVRFIIIALCGGLMITFANFTVLVGLTDAIVFFILMIGIGILIGLYSTEIQYSVLSGLASIFLGFLIFYIAITIPIWYVSWRMTTRLAWILRVFVILCALPLAHSAALTLMHFSF